MSLTFPAGRFAFTIFDDTDRSTCDNTKPVYDFLSECGFRTTKSCWVREPEPDEKGNCPGLTTENQKYLAWLKELQRSGFEIALHNVSWAPSSREQTIKGFDRFRDIFGDYPDSLANHTGNIESIYWGDARVTGIRKLLYTALTRFKNYGKYNGHIESSSSFWGDICRDRVKYLRNFTYISINTSKACPFMPYHDPRKPYVRYWFASTDGHNCSTFCKRISESNQDHLEADGGVCIMYTHFGKNFYRNGKIDPEFKRLMTRLSQKDGWFAPVSTVLDYMAKQKGFHNITTFQRSILEWKWLFEKILVGHS